jgi:hypothetical protein
VKICTTHCKRCTKHTNHTAHNKPLWCLPCRSKQSTDFLLNLIGWKCVTLTHVTSDFMAICVRSISGNHTLTSQMQSIKVANCYTTRINTLAPRLSTHKILISWGFNLSLIHNLLSLVCLCLPYSLRTSGFMIIMLYAFSFYPMPSKTENILMKTKIHVFITNVKSVLLCGWEIWIVTTQITNKL